MKIVGLITEYNPFHNGHRYHIEKAKEITGADYCIAVMSGDFVQRGTPAFMPKHIRTEIALNAGCDMVIELPVRYATGSAEYFAAGAINILDGLGCIESICFGSECGGYDSLEKIALVLTEEPEQFRTSLQHFLKQGLSFPLARQKALKVYFQDAYLDSIMEEPNNILGIEYIKALKLQKSNMKGYTLTRKGASYHDTQLSETFSSASAIRGLLTDQEEPDFNRLENNIPSSCMDILKNNYGKRYPLISNDFSLLLRYRLLSETKESLIEYMDVTADLANRIINNQNHFLNYSQFCELLKTKELTYSRISRCLIHILLNIKDNDSYCPSYAHVLGFRKESAKLFSFMKAYSRIPVITNISKQDYSLLYQDIYASDLYENVISDKFNRPFINELTKQIVKI